MTVAIATATLLASCASPTEETAAADPFCDYDHDGYLRASCGGPDCCDNDAAAHPGVVNFSAEPTACGHFDFNCDGAEETLWPDADSACSSGGAGQPCIGNDGWLFRPACGEEGAFVECTPPSCAGISRPETQQCR